MERLDCQFLVKHNGWHCHLLEGRAEEVLYVSTPVLFADGKPFDFYLTRRGATLVLTDDGLTLYALRNYGMQLDSRRSWRGIESIVGPLGFQLEEDGSITCILPSEQLAWWMNRILRLACAIAEWQNERIEQGDTDFGLTEEVERIMRLKAPNRSLTHHPRVKLKGVDYAFDFLWGDTYVDALAPSATSVSARLRKAIFASQENDAMRMLFVLDDRVDEGKARRELPVLGAVAQTILLNDFETHYEAREA